MSKEKISLTDRVALSALKIAAKRPWSAVKLEEIAKATKTPLPELKKSFPGKSAVLSAIVSFIDKKSFQTVHMPGDGKSGVHDRLFEILMARFDVMQKYRASIASVAKASFHDPATASALLQAQFASMLAIMKLAGIESGGIKGVIKQAGLLLIYQTTLHRWISDDSRDMTPTMAVLGRGLGTAGKIMKILENCPVADV